MNAITSSQTSGFIGQMRDSGIAINIAVKIHAFMRQSASNQNDRKVVRVVLQNIRKNYNATH